MKYVITDTSVIWLNESSGVIQNISATEQIELSDSADFTDSVILYPLNQCQFSTRLYIRGVGKLEQPIEILVAPFAQGSSSGGGTQSVDDGSVATDNEADEYFDSIFGGDSGNSNSSGNTQTVDDDAVATDDEADEYFDSIFGGLGG